MEPDRLLTLFDDLAARVAVALGGLDDWGPSGERYSQYRHDVVADDLILEGLADAGLAVLSEESGLVGAGAVTVVVDPVDGSTNGSRGLPWYAASLCAVDDEGPLASLVVNLATGLRYRAIRGRGARRDRSPIVVGSARPAGPSASEAPAASDPSGGSDPAGGRHGVGLGFEAAAPIVTPPTVDLSAAIVGFSGLPPAHGGWAQYRALGAAALDLCAVADGTLDGYVDVDRAHGVWDYLGALLVCREAGATVVDLAGEDLVVLDPEARRGPVAGATDGLVDQLLAMAAAWT